MSLSCLNGPIVVQTRAIIIKKKTTRFEMEIFGIPEIGNIHKDMLNSVVCNLEFVISEMYDETEAANDTTDTQL